MKVLQWQQFVGFIPAKLEVSICHKIPTTPWGNWSKWQIHSYTLTNDNPMTVSWFSPYLGGGIIGNPTPALLPI
jgi:hypothetical protein